MLKGIGPQQKMPCSSAEIGLWIFWFPFKVNPKEVPSKNETHMHRRKNTKSRWCSQPRNPRKEPNVRLNQRFLGYINPTAFSSGNHEKRLVAAGLPSLVVCQISAFPTSRGHFPLNKGYLVGPGTKKTWTIGPCFPRRFSFRSTATSGCIGLSVVTLDQAPLNDWSAHHLFEQPGVQHIAKQHGVPEVLFFVSL